MGLSRGQLSKIDGRLRGELDHADGVQLVKVPVSDAVWATWKRYCDLVGLTMGQGIAALLQTELATVVEQDLEGMQSRLETRQAELDKRAKELTETEKALAQDRRSLNLKLAEVSERLREVAAREENVAALERSLGRTLQQPTRPSPTTRSATKLGRNDPCWCGSGKKYKACHLPHES